MCLHHRHERQQNCCICIHIRQLGLVNTLFDTDYEARLINVLNWYIYGEHAVELYPTIVFRNEAYFHISGYMNFQNNWHLCPMLIHEMQLHNVTVIVWCAVFKTMNAHSYVICLLITVL